MFYLIGVPKYVLRTSIGVHIEQTFALKQHVCATRRPHTFVSLSSPFLSLSLFPGILRVGHNSRFIRVSKLSFPPKLGESLPRNIRYSVPRARKLPRTLTGFISLSAKVAGKIRRAFRSSRCSLERCDGVQIQGLMKELRHPAPRFIGARQEIAALFRD